MSDTRRKIFFDGGCRPNPGPIEVAAVVQGVTHICTNAGSGSNHDAEWSALIHAARIAVSAQMTNVVFIGDSRPVIHEARAALTENQGAGNRDADDQMADDATATTDHAAIFRDLARCLQPVRIRWVKRSQNLAGVALARRHPR